MSTNFDRFPCARGRTAGWISAVCLGAGALTAETITVLNSEVGTTPERLGYNLGHFMPDSNAADWFRYSGVDAARIFISVSDIEPSDDLPPSGDGVNSESSFFNRRDLLRANAGSTTAALSNSYIKWSVFTNNYSDTATGSNRLQAAHVLSHLRERNVAALTNLTASPSRFPITSINDWAGRWELWQHFYAQAFLLSRDFGVADFSTFNEPNGWDGMTEEDWLLRLQIASDAIQAAVADMNLRYAKSIVPRILAPNTANGAEKYNTTGVSETTTDTWGRDAVVNRHLQLNGSSSPGWMNFHLYNYQKYTSRTHASGGLSGYLNDYDNLRGLIDADMEGSGEPQMPMALTEFNVRTGASYDTVTATQDSPSDFTALGASCVALASRGINRLYLFKFGQTASTSTYGVAKNGTHYVQNGTTANNYGGATQCAEVYRLFTKAAKGGRPRLELAATAGASPGINSGLWSMATRDPATDTTYLFLANRNTTPIPLDVDFTALGVAPGNPAYVEEVSSHSSGGIVRVTSLAGGKLPLATMPGESIWLITLPSLPTRFFSQNAVADTRLGDGSSKTLPGGAATLMEVRADGSVDGRKVSLIRIPVPLAGSAGLHSVLLELDLAATSGSVPVKAHVYGVDSNGWNESTLTWSGASAWLKQNLAAGNQIARNPVVGQGTTSRILGQCVASSTTAVKRWLDVTDFAKSRTDGFASFLIVQDHRWDVAQPSLTTGDTQPAGLLISSRESGSPPRLIAVTSELPPAITSQPQSTVVAVGAPFTLMVVATGTAPIRYQWRRNGIDIPGATTSSHTVANVRASDAGDYQVVVENPLGSITSNTATLEVTLPGTAIVAREATIRGGSFGASDVDETSAGYLMVKYSASLDAARKTYFQFDLPAGSLDSNASATFQIGFQSTFAHQVQLWGLNQSFTDFTASLTWDRAPANQADSNNLLTSGTVSATPIGDSVRINPGSALTPYSFTLPRIGDYLFGNRITLVLTGVDQATNNSGGLRVALSSAKLEYTAIANHPPTLTTLADVTLSEDGSTGPLTFEVSDLETAADSLVVTASASDSALVPAEGLVLQGQGATRSLTITPAAGRHGSAVITLHVSDGQTSASRSFKLVVLPDSPWVNWKQSSFGPQAEVGGIAGPMADPDQDGMENLLEYALGGDPLVSDRRNLPLLTVADGRQFRFKRDPERTDCQIFVETAFALDDDWADAAASSAGSPFVALLPGISVAETSAGGLREVTLTDSNPPSGRRFFRLRTVLQN